jgi:hypothetical protein
MKQLLGEFPASRSKSLGEGTKFPLCGRARAYKAFVASTKVPYNSLNVARKPVGCLEKCIFVVVSV